MTVDLPVSHDMLRVRSRNCFILATGMLGVFAAHWAVTGAFRSGVALVLFGWSTSFMALGVAVRQGWIPLKWLTTWSGSISLVASTLLIQLTGGPSSPYFPMLGALPFTLAIFTPNIRALSAGATVATLVIAGVMDVWAHLPLPQVLMQLSCFTMIGLVASFGVKTYQRMHEAEKAALEQLAESERRRLRAEQERSQVERLVLVGQLAAGVAHEVNNPLAFVKSNLCFIKEELQREESSWNRAELGEVLAETQQGVLRIQQIISDLRSFSRERSGTGEIGLPEDALHEAKRLASVRLRSLGEVSLDLPPGLPTVQLAQRQLVQILVNLLLNAADAVETARPARRAHIEVRARRVESGVRLEVEDNGPGIPLEVLPRIFDPFFTTKPPGKGTGLGLALCREYVSRAGGTLTAENRPGGGARFVLVLPEGVRTVSAATGGSVSAC